MNIRLTHTILVCLTALFSGCKDKTDVRFENTKPEEATDETALGHGHEGHNHNDEHELSDLDRPVEELFALDCEHGIKTYQCDECRYEVGVVKAPSSLFDGGLLRLTRARLRVSSQELALTGEVQFDERRVAHVSTQAGGIIKKVYVARGDKVERGQALVELDSVAVGEARADYLEARGILALAEQNYRRLEALEKEGIPSQKEILNGKQELETARIRADAALGKLTRLGTSAGATVSNRKARSSGRVVLRSPIKGTVLEMHAVSGEVASSESPLLTVGDNDTLWVWADLYEKDVGLVIEEQAKNPIEAQITVKAFPGEEFSGTLDYISPSMDRSSRTIKARIIVLNKQRRLLSGMFANVALLIPGKDRTLTVPQTAVMEDEGQRFVFVHYKQDYYIRRRVHTGRLSHGWLEILSGLKEGDKVVADGAFLLKSDVLRSKMGAGCAD